MQNNKQGKYLQPNHIIISDFDICLWMYVYICLNIDLRDNFLIKS